MRQRAGKAVLAGAAGEVVVTGIGCVSPLGRDAETTWRNLLRGGRGIRLLSADDWHGLPPPQTGFVGGPAVGIADARPVGAGNSGAVDPLEWLLQTATAEAVAQAGLDLAALDRGRVGCVLGTSKGSLTAFAHLALQQHAALQPRQQDAAAVPSLWECVPAWCAGARVANALRVAGPRLTPVAACATGLVSVLRGADLIREGACDVALAGSGDASLHPAVLGSFRRMGVLATQYDAPGTACRPFNADRDGFAVGEGAAVFVLERRAHAIARGATPLATILGGVLLSDPVGLTAVDPAAETLTYAITQTLRNAGLRPADLSHINLHGTATRANDAAEATGLRRACGAASEAVPCVALKGALGHLLGAAGAVELAVSLLAQRDRVLPPTVNRTEPDPQCRLPLSATATVLHAGCGLKISLGFGGHVAVACFA